jgi:hypothetical protein
MNSHKIAVVAIALLSIVIQGCGNDISGTYVYRDVTLELYDDGTFFIAQGRSSLNQYQGTYETRGTTLILDAKLMVTMFLEITEQGLRKRGTEMVLVKQE